MKIRNVRHIGERDRRDFLVLAQFNIEILPGVLLYDLQLHEAPDGGYFLYTPKNGRAPTSSFSPEVRNQIITIARDAIEHAKFRRAA